MRTCCYFQVGFFGTVTLSDYQSMAVDFQLKTPMFTLTVIHFWGTTILYCTTAHNGKGKETQKHNYSPEDCNIFTCSLFLQVLLRPSVPLPASAKKHSSIAIYPSWPSRSQGLSQLAGLPLMWSILYEPGLDQLTKKP